MTEIRHREIREIIRNYTSPIDVMVSSAEGRVILSLKSRDGSLEFNIHTITPATAREIARAFLIEADRAEGKG